MNSALECYRRWVPRRWRGVLRRLWPRRIYHGDFATWAAAQQASGGYADRAIFDKMVSAARAVRDGRASWERDTVLFSEPLPNEPLLRCLRIAAAANGGRLNLVDFGGALGSTWWQHRSWLTDLADVRWSVVEQAAIVTAGRREFTLPPLQFFGSIAECVAIEAPTVILLSSVLPYLENPHVLPGEVRAGPFRHVIVDRTGFTSRGRDRLTVQRVPRQIYEASYPCWFFDRASLLASFGPGWRVIDEWVTNDATDIDAQHGGFMLEKTS